jgi:hypothetical protein
MIPKDIDRCLCGSTSVSFDPLEHFLLKKNAETPIITSAPTQAPTAPAILTVDGAPSEHKNYMPSVKSSRQNVIIGTSSWNAFSDPSTTVVTITFIDNKNWISAWRECKELKNGKSAKMYDARSIAFFRIFLDEHISR